MIFGYTSRTDWRDSRGHSWHPATDFITRLAGGKDSVAQCWWTNATDEPIRGTADPELYRYGVHEADFWVNVTVGPGKYHARLKFAATRGQNHWYLHKFPLPMTKEWGEGQGEGNLLKNAPPLPLRAVVAEPEADPLLLPLSGGEGEKLLKIGRLLTWVEIDGQDPRTNCFDICINGRRAVERFDVSATAGGSNRAVDLVFNDLAPRNGIIEVRLTGAERLEGGKPVRGEAFLQALEIGPGHGGRGAKPVSVPAQ